MREATREPGARRQDDDRLRSACLLTAAAWIGLSIVFILQPAALSPGISFPMEMTAVEIAAFWEARPHLSPVHVGLHLSALVAALASLGVVASVARRLGPAVHWASWLAALGLATMAVSNVRYLALERTFARLHLEAGPEAASTVAVASASLALDPYGILEFGLLGIWLVVVTRHVVPRPRWPLRATAAVGALGFIGMVFGAVAWPPALDVAPVVGTPALVCWLLLLPGALTHERPEPT